MEQSLDRSSRAFVPYLRDPKHAEQSLDKSSREFFLFISGIRNMWNRDLIKVPELLFHISSLVQQHMCHSFYLQLIVSRNAVAYSIRHWERRSDRRVRLILNIVVHPEGLRGSPKRLKTT